MKFLIMQKWKNFSLNIYSKHSIQRRRNFFNKITSFIFYKIKRYWCVKVEKIYKEEQVVNGALNVANVFNES